MTNIYRGASNFSRELVFGDFSKNREKPRKLIPAEINSLKVDPLKLNKIMSQENLQWNGRGTGIKI